MWVFLAIISHFNELFTKKIDEPASSINIPQWHLINEHSRRIGNKNKYNLQKQVKSTLHWQPEPCRLDVTISAHYDWFIARQSTSFSPLHWNLRNLTLQLGILPHKDVSRSLHSVCLHSTFAQLYNAAASPASRLCSAGSLAISSWDEIRKLNRLKFRHSLVSGLPII